MSNDKQAIDPFQLKKHYDPLRVADVCDALDGIGYFNLGLEDLKTFGDSTGDFSFAAPETRPEPNKEAGHHA